MPKKKIIEIGGLQYWEGQKWLADDRKNQFEIKIIRKK